MTDRSRRFPFLLALSLLMCSLTAGTAQAIPTLQLDIAGGSYVGGTENTIFSTGPVFDLYAYLKPAGSSTLAGKYYLAAAIVPQTAPPGGDYGTFRINNTTVAATSGMTYGVPPMETVLGGASWDKGDLARHGIYETYFSEFQFMFNSTNRSGIYNTQDYAGQGPIPVNGGTPMYFAQFAVDTSGLVPGYAIHFDLYNEKMYLAAKSGNPVGDIDINDFAPFSHDAQSGSPIPEPGTIVLLGTGLVGLAGWGRKRFIK